MTCRPRSGSRTSRCGTAIPRERILSLKEYAIRSIQRRVVYDDFEALHDVDLRRGRRARRRHRPQRRRQEHALPRRSPACCRPPRAASYVAGRVAPILELGLGFHGELTGRENVMLQGALLGFSRAETRRRLDRIVEWAELEDFIDAPIRTYSTGMSARLAFAVATDVDPDILLVDEALSVGDEKFQRKCHDRMEGLRARGKTFMLVSHSLSQIRDNCDRVDLAAPRPGRPRRGRRRPSPTRTTSGRSARRTWWRAGNSRAAEGRPGHGRKRSGSEPVEREPEGLDEEHGHLLARDRVPRAVVRRRRSPPSRPAPRAR